MLLSAVSLSAGRHSRRLDGAQRHDHGVPGRGGLELGAPGAGPGPSGWSTCGAGACTAPAGPFSSSQLLKLSGSAPSRSRSAFPSSSTCPASAPKLQVRYEKPVVTSSPSNFSPTERCDFARRTADPCLRSWLNKKTIADRGACTSSGLALAILKRSSVAEDDIALKCV